MAENNKKVVINESIEEWEVPPVKKTWRTNFEQIDKTLEEIVTPQKRKNIMTKIDRIINILVKNGETYEDLVLSTAEIYIFIKSINADINSFSDLYVKHIISGVETLISNNLDEIFDGKKMLYLEKIKLAEYIEIFESKKQTEQIKNEVNYVINNFEDNLNVGLITMLKQLMGEENGK